MWLDVHSNLLLMIREGGGSVDGIGRNLCPTAYSLHCHHQIDSALRRAAV